MSNRIKRMIKLVPGLAKTKKPCKKKKTKANIPPADACSSTGRCESPIPAGYEKELIQLEELIGDVLTEPLTEDTVRLMHLVGDNAEKIGESSFSDTFAATSATIAMPVSEISSVSDMVRHDKSPLAASVSPAPAPALFADNVEGAISNESLLTAPTIALIARYEDKTPIPSPAPGSPHLPCDSAFCVTEQSCHQPDSVSSIPILNNEDDLYGNLPTPSVASTDTMVTPTTIKTRKKTYKTDKGKKRLQHKENWQVTQRKLLKNKGKSFTNQRGKCIPEKQIKEPCSSGCRLKCSEKITDAQRLHIFSKFWELGCRNGQWEYVLKYTQKVPKRRQTTEKIKHNRKNTYIYYLPLKKEKIRVCKTMFLNTLSTSERIVTTSLKKYDGDTLVEEDKRGKYELKQRIIDDEMVKSVCDHVNSFSPVESHYIRQDSTKLYLDGVKSMSRMYKLYDEWFDKEKYSNKATTKRQYRDIVNKNFNLAFFKPKKDRCDVCHSYENKEMPTEEEKKIFLDHRRHKFIARDLRKSDKTTANSEGTIVAAMFDFEKVLVTPYADVSILYYKKKLPTLNFTIYNMASKAGTCYMWHEGIAKRGANEVSSCLYDFIKENVSKGVNEFRFWSDNCAGQNRNRIVFYLYLFAAKEFGVTILHRFMEKGHTQNEGDSVHSTIETASKGRYIYVPDEWYCLARWAKCEGKPYTVKEMVTEKFWDFKSLLTNKNWIKNTCNEKVQWTQIKEVKVQADQPDRMEYKYNFEKEPKTIIVLRSATRNTQRTSRDIVLKPAYQGLIPISYDKYKDLVGLCNSYIIPIKYHSFYKNLPYTSRNVRQNHDSETENDDD